jgi:opacity protein-like surface antigen
MRLKLILRVILAALFMTVSFPVYSQTVPAATQSAVRPLTVGVGLSSFDPDWAHGRMLGGTLWIDYTPRWMPRILYGLGLEVEGRDINYSRSSSQPPNLREDTAGGGVVYTWYRFNKFHPYGKFLAGFGNTDHESTNLVRHHDSRTITCVGGGLEYKVDRRIWMRADYEYQRWPEFFMITKPAGLLNPQGITVGVSYDLSSSHFRLFRK